MGDVRRVVDGPLFSLDGGLGPRSVARSAPYQPGRHGRVQQPAWSYAGRAHAMARGLAPAQGHVLGQRRVIAQSAGFALLRDAGASKGGARQRHAPLTLMPPTPRLVESEDEERTAFETSFMPPSPSNIDAAEAQSRREVNLQQCFDFFLALLRNTAIAFDNKCC